MIRIRRATVVRVDGGRPGLLRLTVDVEGVPGGEARAIAYPVLSGPVSPGDAVLLNTTAVDMGLGSGGWHFVIAVERPHDLEPEGPHPGRTMKLRYTPEQVAVAAVEEERSPHHATMTTADTLEGVPVVWVPLHSM